jgi:hypothetical protein
LSCSHEKRRGIELRKRRQFDEGAAYRAPLITSSGVIQGVAWADLALAGAKGLRLRSVCLAMRGLGGHMLPTEFELKEGGLSGGFGRHKQKPCRPLWE